MGGCTAVDCGGSTVTGTIKKSVMEEVTELTVGFLAKNLAPAQAVRSYAGKLSHVATVISTWRPFLGELWAALTGAAKAQAAGSPDGGAPN